MKWNRFNHFGIYVMKRLGMPMIAFNLARNNRQVTFSMNQRMQHTLEFHWQKEPQILVHLATSEYGLHEIYVFAKQLFKFIKRFMHFVHASVIIIYRCAILTAIFVPLSVAFPIWYISQGVYNVANDDAPSSLWWIYWLAWSLEISGPAFTKVELIV